MRSSRRRSTGAATFGYAVSALLALRRSTWAQLRIPAAVAGLIVNPACFIWLGLILRRG